MDKTLGEQSGHNGHHNGHHDGHKMGGDYNFEHFRPRHLWSDVVGTVEVRGVHPGEAAPDFTLTRADGGTMTLSDLRGKPVLLHFGSPT